eukprot:1314441-Rhodomonas_salina.1
MWRAAKAPSTWPRFLITPRRALTALPLDSSHRLLRKKRKYGAVQILGDKPATAMARKCMMPNCCGGVRPEAGFSRETSALSMVVAAALASRKIPMELIRASVSTSTDTSMTNRTGSRTFSAPLCAKVSIAMCPIKAPKDQRIDSTT